MKKYIISIMVLALLSLVAIPQVHAVDVSKEQCREMLALGDKAMTDKNFETAKNYYKRAIKYDPWSTTAWSKYDLLVKVTSGDGAADISGFDFSTKAAPKQAVEEESDDDLFGGGGGAPSFEGC